jgi:hypothetical protein
MKITDKRTATPVLQQSEANKLKEFWLVKQTGDALGAAVRELAEDLRHYRVVLSALNDQRKELESDYGVSHPRGEPPHEFRHALAGRVGVSDRRWSGTYGELLRAIAITELRLSTVQAEHDNLLPRAQSNWAIRDALKQALVESRAFKLAELE